MDRFLERLRESGNVRAACQAAGVNRATVYRWRGRWSTFRAEWEEAIEEAVDLLEEEAWERATTGKSDKVLMFLLKAYRPRRYKDRLAHEHSGSDGKPLFDDTSITVILHNGST